MLDKHIINVYIYIMAYIVSFYFLMAYLIMPRSMENCDLIDFCTNKYKIAFLLKKHHLLLHLKYVLFFNNWEINYQNRFIIIIKCEVLKESLKRVQIWIELLIILVVTIEYRGFNNTWIYLCVNIFPLFSST